MACKLSCSFDEIQEAENGITALKYFYAKKNSQLEIDFLIEQAGQVVPIEVKAEENLKARSLRQFVTENHPEIAYRLSMSNHREESWLTNIPLFAVETIG